MRYTSYFTGLALFVIPALLATMVTGIVFDGTERHLTIGLIAALAAGGAQSALILFVVVTARTVRAAMETRPLDDEYLDGVNRYFGTKGHFFKALFAVLVTATAAVLGYANRAFGIPPEVHMSFGIAAVVTNIWALRVGFVTLRTHQGLIDRVVSELDRIDRETPEVIRDREIVLAPREIAKRWLMAGTVAWLPFVYWGLMEWRGDFSAMSLWVPGLTLAFTVFALVRARLAMRPPGLVAG